MPASLSLQAYLWGIERHRHPPRALPAPRLQAYLWV